MAVRKVKIKGTNTFKFKRVTKKQRSSGLKSKKRR